MSIEKDINQTKFRNEYQKSMVNLIYTYNWMTEQLKDVFGKENLTMQQYNILRILRGSDIPLSTMQIRDRMLDKMSDTSRIVDRLVIKGLAKKIVSKTDKRLVDITITTKGRKSLHKIDLQEKEVDKIANALSVADAQTLNTLLDKLRKSE
ncbi:MarR family winged helix-turn-helix transcriptional regulator [Ferruginibacter albus]|uniref:MarR family winged helix-turn-helix transcriptional regulator n=1 Tax=Ferruginibacter albus TaxID=2875540 RepID=UPI001CC75A70|nr:MarR family transcriptional regulator [Ferruginibacter albus]UAY51955.1 MarR family transcriptional regulator [Ferruginibacter albus]